MQELVQITRYPRREYYGLIRQLDEQKNKQILEPQLPLDKLTIFFSRNVVTDDSEPVPECITCGVCCAFALIVPVSNEDSRQLASYCDITLDEDDTVVIDRVLPRQDNGNCANLGGVIREHVGCTVYNERPKVCHDFDSGSDRCHAYRRMYGVEPPLSETQVAEAMAKLNDVTLPPQIDFVRILFGEMALETMPVPDGTLTRSRKIKLNIVAFLDNDPDTMHLIHTFDPSKETWFESDFLTMSLDEAREMTASRAGK